MGKLGLPLLDFCNTGDENNAKEFNRVERLVTQIEVKEQTSERKKYLGMLGVCWNCRHLRYVRTKYGKEEAVCVHYEHPDRLLNPTDPVVECSDHDDKFSMSLATMWELATLIDAAPPKQAGFIHTESEIPKREKEKKED